MFQVPFVFHLFQVLPSWGKKQCDLQDFWTVRSSISKVFKAKYKFSHIKDSSYL